MRKVWWGSLITNFTANLLENQPVKEEFENLLTFDRDIPMSLLSFFHHHQHHLFAQIN